MIITYKGYTIELGELPEPRKAYWRIVYDTPYPERASELHTIHEVECGSYLDLERIAKREIDKDEQNKRQ